MAVVGVLKKWGFKPCQFPFYSDLRLASNSSRHFKLAIIGGGSGGCSIAAKFAAKLGKNAVAVIEPAKNHYYQPMFTLVGGGIKKLKESENLMAQVLPKNCVWINESAVTIRPEDNAVVTSSGQNISYEFLVVAAGLSLDYHKIPGVLDALSVPNSGVCSNYSPKYAEKTYLELRNFEKGNMIFTFPNTPVKCAGAPQKICYIAEHYLRMNNKRDKATIIYNTSLGVIFGVKKYADELWKICNNRDIHVNLRTNLVRVLPKEKLAIFENLDKPDEPHKQLPYAMLHVTPPMSAAAIVTSAPQLADATGFLNVNKVTLQHSVFSNIFGIGDCTNLPTSKTAAAVAAQCGVLEKNLWRVMRGQPPQEEYDGYTSCPLVTGYNSCILAEFDYNLQPLETFPLNQARESTLMFHMKKTLMPTLYWQAMLKGNWNGPRFVRKALSLNMRR